MSISQPTFEELKEILENFRSPERLDDHPWTHSLLVQDALERDLSLAERIPGYQLVLVVAELFREMTPPTPPVRGKRLDTRWGRFGILAANYFAPLLYGGLYPRSLRDAWRRIDPALLLFVFGEASDGLEPEQAEAYHLIGDELDMPANSTISDWHRGGLEELAELFVNREVHLSQARGEPSPVLDQEIVPGTRSASRKRLTRSRRRSWPWKWILLGLGLLLLASGIAAGLKARQILSLANAFQDDISALQSIDIASFDPANVEQFGLLLTDTQADLGALGAEVTPWFWLTSRLGWLPVYGGDLEHADDLLEMASAFLDAVDVTYQSVFPIWQAVYMEKQDIKATELTGLYLATKPALLQAQEHLRLAQSARERIDPAALSPRTQKLVVRVDPYLGMLEEALSLSLSLPGLLGGAEDGPKTYLVLIQNEDELRPTGGFISAVGKLVVYNGELVSWSVEDSYNVDNPEASYFATPWQLDSFMNLQIFLFRDSNFISDYPVAAKWAEYLYALKYSQTVDGIIAIDQHVLASLLAVTGPVYVPEIETTINAKNILEVMRAQKIPPSKEERDPDWHRKQFMNPIGAAVLDRLLSGQGFSWEQALRSVLTLLDERHILVQLDDPALTEILAERGWDGAVRNLGGDFLMLVDTNVGYSKSNAVVSSRISYDIDLTNLSAPPISNLVVFQKNDAQGEMGEHCDQRAVTVNKWYPIERCYFNYLRVYVPAGASLLDATPHAVTREDMIFLDKDTPARVDELDWEEIENVRVFGTLFFVRMGESLETSFRFGLPNTVLEMGPDGRTRVYHLKIQKQPGIISTPVSIRVHLPNGAEVQSMSPEGLQEGTDILFNLELRKDIEIEIVFIP